MRLHRHRRPRFGRRRLDDRGAAMLYAISLTLVSAAVLTPLSATVVSETLRSGRFRQSNGALSAAEGQLDAEISRITSVAAAGSLPCTGAPVTEWTGVDSFSVTTTITYKSGSGTDLGCPVRLGAQPTAAVVKAVATTANPLVNTVPVRRVMLGTLRLTGSGGPGGGTLPSALFAGQNISMRNGMTLNVGGGSLAPSPRVYTNGDFACTNGMSLAGSVLAQGRVTAQNACTVNGDVHAVGPITVGNAGRFGGDVTASAGSVSLGNATTASGSVYASGNVSGCVARCYPFTPPPPPEREDLPSITWDATSQGTWQNAGWTLVSFDDPRFCSVAGRANAPAQWLIDNGPRLTSPVVVHTTCPFVVTNGVSFTFNQNVAVVADGGAEFRNGISFDSATGGSSFQLIQPLNAVARPCTGQGLSFGNGVSISSRLATLLYTPCDVDFQNGETMSGQVYAGARIIADNGFTMKFTQLSVPGQGTTTTAYSVAVTSKYEGG
jgi:hypothetical protein